MSKYIYLDFEFNRTTERHLNLICVAWEMWDGVLLEAGKLWLLDPEQAEEFRNKVGQWIYRGYTFVAYAVTAEARSIESLGFDPVEMQWIDLYLEYRMLLNHNHEYAYGKQLQKGRVKWIAPPVPKAFRTEEDDRRSGKPEYNLAAACYKLLDVIVDTDHKDAMRALIISDPEEFGPDDRAAILEYCGEDVAHLRELHKRLWKINRTALLPEHRKTLRRDMLLRGDYAARSAVMEAVGYPIDYEATKNFAGSVNEILTSMQEEITGLFPDVQPFEFNKRTGRYVQKQKNLQEWIRRQGFPNWMPTNSGGESLSLDAFARYFESHDAYRTGSLGAHMLKYLKTKQSLNGFLPPKKGKKNFWDSIGSDHRVRPYFGIYGSQSARSQPAATGFIPLKSSWMRVLIEPDPGRAIAGIDWSQQEFLLAALLSEDPGMIRAYQSGDVYLYTGKLAGAIPQDATRDTHEDLRNLFKSTVLGIQYLMGPRTLSGKLTRDTGKTVSIDEAEQLIDQFNAAYPIFSDWREEVVADYRRDGYLRLPCGWVMWGDNPNHRSIANCPIQGTGSSIMRRAVSNAQDAGLQVIYTLHDAIYIEFDSDNLYPVDQLAFAMQEAFKAYFPMKMQHYADCRMDPSVWSPDYDGSTVSTAVFPEVKLYEKYIDPRSVSDYRRYRPYFHDKEGIDALLSM